MSVWISLLAALFKAVPALESLARQALELLGQARAADALRRKADKDAAVDAACSEKKDHI